MKKLLNVLLILAFVFTIPVAYAHNIPVDKENIKIEDNEGNIYSGSKIIVDESIGEYTLYYQYVEIENDAYNAYKEKLEEQKETLEDYLEVEGVDNIEEASDEIKESYNAAMEEAEKYKEQLLPAYEEENWIESTDNTASLDLTKVPTNSLGYQPYVLWLKVVPKEEGEDTIYSDRVVLAKKQVIDPESKEEVPSTGDSIIWVGLAAVALAGIMVVSYKKMEA